ncbi:unnamed protein product [Sphenostylis stenocarpa]|uniref:Uncharacterized protein n=1 Tax=Sphenostylis stenocarpa TaxID=92480 RepID=A0AA86TIZ5_9FABA|nr:unnamed protein product [Sphenostylis stenocarpa]
MSDCCLCGKCVSELLLPLSLLFCHLHRERPSVASVISVARRALVASIVSTTSKLLFLLSTPLSPPQRQRRAPPMMTLTTVSVSIEYAKLSGGVFNRCCSDCFLVIGSEIG